MLIKLQSDRVYTKEEFLSYYRGLKAFLNTYVKTSITTPEDDEDTKTTLVFTINHTEFLGFMSGLFKVLQDDYQYNQDNPMITTFGTKASYKWKPDIIIVDLFYDRATLFIYDGYIE